MYDSARYEASVQEKTRQPKVGLETMSLPKSQPLMFRILKGSHVSHFHSDCPSWPTENFYDQDKPLWWGEVCKDCGRLADEEHRKRNPP